MDAWVDPHPWQASASSSTSTIPGGATSTAPSSTARRMKNTHVLDQSDETEFDVADETQHAKWIQTYVRTMGSLPPEEEEPSVEQMSAFARRVITHNGAPYTDFSVWVPYGKKAYRASK